MPAEKFYLCDQVENDGRIPDVTVAWGSTPEPQVLVNGCATDRSALNRLISVLRKARDRVHGPDA